MKVAELEEVFGTRKPIIAMAHFPPLPGSPEYSGTDPEKIKEDVLRDVKALVDGGIDAVMFCNEGDRPYLKDLDPVTLATMSRVIGEVKKEMGEDLEPFGTDILWSPKGAIALGKAVGGTFVREVFTGAYGGETGIWDTDCGSTLRYQKLIEAQDLKLLYNINAEFAQSLSQRSLVNAAQSAVFASLADIVCVSGPMTGQPTDPDGLKEVKQAVPETPVFANTGVNIKNVEEFLSIADGVVIGTSLKVDGETWNPVEESRVREFMEKVGRLRS